MKISSRAFNNNDPIPPKYTCLGENINPPLTIEQIPNNARSLVLVLDDPDAPNGSFVHWLLWNIPIEKKINIQENCLPSGAEIGKNSSGNIGYTGPCPPSGTHRYIFQAYAIDIQLRVKEKTKNEVLDKIQSHILDKAELKGTFSKT
jgi:Raf kinase inhibitor-like YbhB/YbcL family protein